MSPDLRDQLEEYFSYVDELQPSVDPRDVLDRTANSAGPVVPKASGRRSSRWWVVAAAAAIILGIVLIPRVLRGNDDLQPTISTDVVNPTPATTSQLFGVDHQVTRAVGPSDVNWSPWPGFAGSDRGARTAEELWQRPPDIGFLGPDSVWVLPHTVCESSMCDWAESPTGLIWTVRGPQPPGGGRFRAVVEQGTISHVGEPTDSDIDAIVSALSSVSAGQPIATPDLLVGRDEGRESLQGLAICGVVADDGAVALNVVAPFGSATNWYGEQVPTSSFWLNFGDSPALDQTPEAWSRDASSCSAGVLRGSLYAFTPRKPSDACPSDCSDHELLRLDAATWIDEPVPAPFETAHDVIFAGARVFAVSDDEGAAAVWSSADFVTWERALSLDNTSLAGTVSADTNWKIEATDFGWLALASSRSPQLFVSSDAIGWERVALPDQASTVNTNVEEIHVGYANGVLVLTVALEGQPGHTTPDWVGTLPTPALAEAAVEEPDEAGEDAKGSATGSWVSSGWTAPR